MIFIYDFDGTLTPYSFPQYKVLKKCNINDIVMKQRLEKTAQEGYNFYEAYYKVYKDILTENGIVMSRDNVCMGAQDVQFNNGVVNYFQNFQSSKTGMKHYIVTSGIKDYVEDTLVSQYVDGIYGTTYYQKNEMFEDINFLLTDKMKVDAIKEIQRKNNETNQIVYFGDGLTDKLAFEYVHSIGGITVFIATNEDAKKVYEKFKKLGIINKCFDGDFRENSSIQNFVRSLM